MKLIIDIPEDVYRRLKAGDTNAGNTFHNTALETIGNGIPYEERPQGELTELTDEVWKLYKRHQSHLATHVIEFGEELADLLGKYNEGGAE